MGVITGYSRRTANIGSGAGSSTVSNIYTTDGVIQDLQRTVDTNTNDSTSSLHFRTLAGSRLFKVYGNLNAELGDVTNGVNFTAYIKPLYTTSAFFRVVNGTNVFGIYGDGLMSYKGLSKLYCQYNGGDNLNVFRIYSTLDYLKINFYAEENEGKISLYGNQVYIMSEIGSKERSFLYKGLVLGDNSAINSSTLLQITDKNKGITISNGTTAQRNAISSPANNLLYCVYDGAATDGLYRYDSFTASWVFVG